MKPHTWLEKYQSPRLIIPSLLSCRDSLQAERWWTVGSGRSSVPPCLPGQSGRKHCAPDTGSKRMCEKPTQAPGTKPVAFPFLLTVLIHYIQKVFRPFKTFQILVCFSLILKWIQHNFSPHHSTHNTPQHVFRPIVMTLAIGLWWILLHQPVPNLTLY